MDSYSYSDSRVQGLHWGSVAVNPMINRLSLVLTRIFQVLSGFAYLQGYTLTMDRVDYSTKEHSRNYSW
jgi:hypothetical protein